MHSHCWSQSRFLLLKEPSFTKICWIRRIIEGFFLRYTECCPIFAAGNLPLPRSIPKSNSTFLNKKSLSDHRNHYAILMERLYCLNLNFTIKVFCTCTIFRTHGTFVYNWVSYEAVAAMTERVTFVRVIGNTFLDSRTRGLDIVI